MSLPTNFFIARGGKAEPSYVQSRIDTQSGNTEYYVYARFNNTPNNQSILNNDFGTGGGIEGYGTLINAIFDPNGTDYGNNLTAIKLYFGGSSGSTVPAINNPSYSITSSLGTYNTALRQGNNATGGGLYLGWSCGDIATMPAVSGYTYNAAHRILRGSQFSPSWHAGGTNSCDCEGTAVFRPHIGNDNYGGPNGGCGQGTQWMGIGFTLNTTVAGL